jgi:hypothetical protein
MEMGGGGEANSRKDLNKREKRREKYYLKM